MPSRKLPKSQNSAIPGDVPAVLARIRNYTDLVFVFGTGTSLALTGGAHKQLSWKGLLSNGLIEAERRGKISKAQALPWRELLDSADIDDLLGVAEHIGRKLDAPAGDMYARWLAQEFESVAPSENTFAEAVRVLARSGAQICTLNYDLLLEAVTGLPPILISDVRAAGNWMRGAPGVLHLHGAWTHPTTVVLGLRDYAKTVGDETRDLFQRTLASFKHLIFVGCGDTFADPNFSSLISWLRSNFRGTSPQHYALVTEQEIAIRLADPTWQGFVEPLSYGPTRAELPEFLSRLVSSPTLRVGIASSKRASPSTESEALLQDYRRFLVKDCGQMTIEGLRADMDTAQRRFDLERLFVPLHVYPTPPEYREGDPDKEAKLEKWRQKNNKAIGFGTAFAKNPRIALLALPGGGKTLLLKRIAVAYADPRRRADAADDLPPLDIVPVLIRCREWREDIRRPIRLLLAAIADTTGQSGLKGLDQALMPLLESGNVLLMIDGLDEIHDDADRTTFVENLEKFLDDYPKIRLIVTSREAGFALVAPSLNRFCTRFRIAPLSEASITELCEHWRTLMAGDTPEAHQESETLTNHLLQNDSIRRLAENPLLLTMLLVVKHGAGRLPPDRVSLYERAVEVLLDTWNIKGHSPLNLKEAVPQLACVAFELLKQGKQTATKQELLSILEQARDNIPQITRYAKDSPDEFLRRVELRSSLLVEAGRQLDGSRLVPFYQFRHLTFQEYLAASAAAEGNYLEYKRGDTVLTPLRQNLVSDEWKEVVPMAAVLAKKQADSLISELVSKGRSDEISILERFGQAKHTVRQEWARPPAVARLTQCLIEEAEIPSEHLESALRLVALFSRGAHNDFNALAILAQGPYGVELYRQAWLLYVDQTTGEDFWVRNTCASLAFSQQRPPFWSSEQGQAELRRMLDSPQPETAAKGLLIICRQFWGVAGGEDGHGILSSFPRESIEKLVAHEEPFVWEPAVWAWALSLFHRPDREGYIQPQIKVLERIKDLFLSEDRPMRANLLGFALYSTIGMHRDYWNPQLTEPQRKRLDQFLKATSRSQRVEERSFGSVVLAFHAVTMTDDQLSKALPSEPTYGKDRWLPLLQQLSITRRKNSRSIN